MGNAWTISAGFLQLRPKVHSMHVKRMQNTETGPGTPTRRYHCEKTGPGTPAWTKSLEQDGTSGLEKYMESREWECESAVCGASGDFKRADSTESSRGGEEGTSAPASQADWAGGPGKKEVSLGCAVRLETKLPHITAMSRGPRGVCRSQLLDRGIIQRFLQSM